MIVGLYYRGKTQDNAFPLADSVLYSCVFPLYAVNNASITLFWVKTQQFTLHFDFINLNTPESLTKWFEELGNVHRCRVCAIKNRMEYVKLSQPHLLLCISFEMSRKVHLGPNSFFKCTTLNQFSDLLGFQCRFCSDIYIYLFT